MILDLLIEPKTIFNVADFYRSRPYEGLTKTIMIPHWCFDKSKCKACAFMDWQFSDRRTKSSRVRFDEKIR